MRTTCWRRAFWRLWWWLSLPARGVLVWYEDRRLRGWLEGLGVAVRYYEVPNDRGGVDRCFDIAGLDELEGMTADELKHQLYARVNRILRIAAREPLTEPAAIEAGGVWGAIPPAEDVEDD